MKPPSNPHSITDCLCWILKSCGISGPRAKTILFFFFFRLAHGVQFVLNSSWIMGNS